MSIANIVDRRKRTYRFQKINAIIEAAWHDNSCPGADRLPNDGGPDYSEREHITLSDAVSWAESYSTPVTLYLYDEDDGIYLTTETPNMDDRPTGKPEGGPS